MNVEEKNMPSFDELVQEGEKEEFSLQQQSIASQNCPANQRCLLNLKTGAILTGNPHESQVLANIVSVILSLICSDTSFNSSV